MRKQARQTITAVMLTLAATSGAATTLSGCRVTSKDVERWERTEMGPTKLVAVVTHSKYDWELRKAAAISLIRMKPRGGRRVGIDKLTKAVAALGAPDRKELIARILPTLEEQMKKAPVSNAGLKPGEKRAPDTSIPYKDAAFGLLRYDKTPLVTDEGHQSRLKKALIDWCQADFDNRLKISSQLYGLQQVLRYFKADGVRGVPKLINPESEYAKMGRLVAELGDDATKDAGAKALVAVARFTESKAWVAKKQPDVEKVNKASGYTGKKAITGKKLAKQMRKYQTEELIKVFASLKKIGRRPTVRYLLEVAGDSKRPETRRQAALAALANHLDRKNKEDVKAILAIAGNDKTPLAVRQLSFMRVGELPRADVAPALYELFNSEEWKIRWVAASTLLKMSSKKHITEFFQHLPEGDAKGFAVNEPLVYGGLIKEMKDGPSVDRMHKEMKNPKLTAKLTALGYFYAHGEESDLKVVAESENDRTPTPKMPEDAKEGHWKCAVPNPKKPKAKPELKDVTTVGEFVKFCVVPKIKRTVAKKKADAAAKAKRDAKAPKKPDGAKKDEKKK